MKKRTKQVTCLCKAYSFPHRLQGGKCDGSEWFNYLFRLQAEECQFCPCNHNSHCDCAEGSESKETCVIYSNLLENGEHIQYPVDAQEEFQNLLNEYEEDR